MLHDRQQIDGKLDYSNTQPSVQLLIRHDLLGHDSFDSETD